jgi:purine nucleosidase
MDQDHTPLLVKDAPKGGRHTTPKRECARNTLQLDREVDIHIMQEYSNKFNRYHLENERETALSQTPGAKGKIMVRLVIDTDPGVDDAHAIMMALAHPDVQVEAITTVAGNVAVHQTTANACKILDQLGCNVPVFAGSEYPLISPNQFAEYVHGKDGLGESGYPLSGRKISTEHAVNALIRMGNEAPGELTLAAIGPLTNLALATRIDPNLPKKYKRLVVMGGAIRAQGNTTPTAEFNTHSDPEAAAIVFEAWKGLTLVSWETTMAYCFNSVQVEELLAMNTPRAEFFRRITGRTISFIEKFLVQRILFAADFLAVAAAIEPDIVVKSEARYLEVELQGQHTRGQTSVDWNGLLGKEPNVDLAIEMNPDRLWELFKMALSA